MRKNEQKARDNENELLLAVATCGHLPTKLIARWVWQKSPEKSALRKAGEVLRRLEEQGYVLRRKTLDCVATWVLTKTGAERLNAKLLEQGGWAWAHHGYDLAFYDYVQRNECSAALLKAREEGAIAVVGKAGLRLGAVKGSEKFKGLDGLIIGRDYTTVGLFVVRNAQPSTLSKIRTLKEQGHAVRLICEPGLARLIYQRLKN